MFTAISRSSVRLREGRLLLFFFCHFFLFFLLFFFFSVAFAVLVDPFSSAFSSLSCSPVCRGRLSFFVVVLVVSTRPRRDFPIVPSWTPVIRFSLLSRSESFSASLPSRSPTVTVGNDRTSPARRTGENRTRPRRNGARGGVSPPFRTCPRRYAGFPFLKPVQLL